MNIINKISAYGFDVVLMLSGFVGALVSLDRKKNLTIAQKSVIVVSGSLTATFVTPLMLPLLKSVLGTGVKIEYGLGFLVGYMGLKSIELLITKFFKVKLKD